MKYKIKFRTHLIIITTSLFWVLIDVFLLMFFADKNPYCILKKVSNESRYTFVKNIINPKILTPIALTSAVLKSSSSSKINQALKPRPKIQESDIKGPGALGTGVVIPEELSVLQKEKFALNQFNLVASEMISLNRSLKDHRLPGCLTKDYKPAQLKATSVVIVFHNEAWTTLLRTIHSIINRSPAHLISDIVLVDDASDREFLKRQLDDYLDAIRHSVSIQMIRLKERSGLIKARLIGAHAAAGPIITFLDAHCEVGIGWLEPLLYEIYLNRTNVAAPIIDVISDETFEYVPASDMTWGGFNWHLNFRWYTAPPRELERRMGDRTLPVLSPTMAGGLFAIDKAYFQELGEYDPGMEVWGGENLEMSFRIWMCGGTLEIVTCSRVGHVFRKTSPYTFPGGVSHVINKNQRRTAEVWLDEWKNFYFKINPSSTTVEAGDITDRLELRKKLQCKSFKWYLENVYPESQMPREFISLGEIKHDSLNMCFDTMGRKGLENIGLFTCHNQGGNQVFMYSAEKLLQNDDLCLQPDPLNKFVIMSPCNTDVKAQQWNYDKETQTIQNADAKLCIALPLSEQFDKIPLSPCSKKGQAQKWHFVNLSL